MLQQSVLLLLSSIAFTCGLSPTGAFNMQRLQQPALFRSATMQLQRASVAMAEVEEEEYMTEEEYEAEQAAAMSEEEYAAEQAAPQEMSEDAARVMNNMRSSSGVEFAPWMKVDPEAIAKAKREREERKARAASFVADAVAIDPQAAELGASSGLKSVVLSEEEVELRWSTDNEVGNLGFVVQRRKGGSEVFTDIASYEQLPALKTKGPGGGSYSYFDDSVAVGTWVYRIVDQDESGKRSALSQKLVEVESVSEQTQTLVIGGVFLLLAAALVAAGIFADPIQTTDLGGRVF